MAIPDWLKKIRKDFFVILIRRRSVKYISRSLLVMLLMIASWGFYYVYFKSDDLPPLKSLAEFKVSSYVYGVDDQIAGRFFYENRDPVRYADIPENMTKAILAAEDKYFFYHPGVNPLSIVRAASDNWIRHHRIVSGASTITQQLVRLLYENEVPEFKRRDMNVWRKIKEARLAIQLERRFSKEEILEAYLNYIYLGHGRFGAVEAARYYFSKELKQLTVPEAAMIAALSKYPARYCPIHNRKLALSRRNWILGMMNDGNITDGKFITDQEYWKYKAEPIKLEVSPTDYSFGYALDFVRRKLLEEKYNPKDIWFNGGLRVRTTINPYIQRTTDNILKAHLTGLNRQFAGEEKLEGAVVVVENHSGKIAAISGGHDFMETKYNRAVQRSANRQPGSAFKIFTYTEALARGMTFQDKICDCPLRLPGKIDFYGRVLQWWTPQNYHEKSHPPFMGSIPLWKGLVLSRNVATLQLARKIGLKNVLQRAKDMGIKSPLSPYLPTIIGASDVGLLELTAAYSIFPSGGLYYEPYMVEEIKDGEGHAVYQWQIHPKAVVTLAVAEDMIVMLRAVTEVGTAKITFKGIVQKVAGKTGTTNDSRDVLFFGFTPEYTIGVRLGYDVPKSLGERQTGGLLAAPVVRKIIEAIYQKINLQPFSAAIEEKVMVLIK